MKKSGISILRRLEAAGYPAYFVGGCVRDTLLGRPVHDWDIASAALPEEVTALFDHCVPTGIKHGTVTVLQDGASFEVTTFRTDGDYDDARHPNAVSFVRTLEEDLSRRDFTINAMAMDASGVVTDLFGGREDLNQKTIRCVGDPETRFREDALRMLRALRFSAQLGFAVEKQTMDAICDCAPLCASLSAERVRDEMEKTLLSASPNTVGEMARLGLLVAVGVTEVAPMAEVAPSRRLRWSAFFSACEQANWTRLKLDRHTGKTAQTAAEIAAPRDRFGWKRVLAECGEAVALCASALVCEETAVQEILESGECFRLQDLAVGGDDFPELSGKAVGEQLQKLLDYVLMFPEKNNRETLLRIAHGK
ncbi:MAG: CCA tRNA nucleotidyltransferase [Oscillospiraceae bacterium]|nr:CCA tRNA nucleotidyltransferase [Oscillospiraceae bacterium]